MAGIFSTEDSALSIQSTGTVDFTSGSMVVRSFDNTAGGTFNHSGGNLFIDRGAFSPASGTYRLSGVDNPNVILENTAQWNASSPLLVGVGTPFGFQSESGTLSVSSGSSLSSSSSTLGVNENATGVVNVTGSGSNWTNTGELVVGHFGDGTLNIDSRGRVTSGEAQIGLNQGAFGTVTVSGTSSRWTNEGFVLGGSEQAQGGFGTLTIADSARVDASGPATIWGGSTLNLNGGTLTTESLDNQGRIAATSGTSLVVGDINNHSGAIQLSGGAVVIFTDDLTQNATLQVTNMVVVQGAFTGSGGFYGGGSLLVQGELRPGNSAASVIMDGNLSLGFFTETSIELGGLGSGEFDQLLISGDFALDGSLSVDLINGFLLGAGQEFLIAEVGGALNGRFLGLGEGGLVGSFGGAELYITYAAGDGNDVALFTAAVPEPTALGLLLFGCSAMAGRRRR